ncbi:response regulator transcription factor [Cellulosilyticum sp. I15G10I2]|uniref:response regulator transcription factor n=1 Tax=Cellulosilyticum sp. I15G10I2 TaxID=1892843 RepID=UPI00085C2106|nr:response regulator transcription factor [Cellulosilyticum sp. I15G10I2]
MNNHSKKILIVEDEEKIVEFIESYLLNSGYEVYKALRGYDALKLFNSQNIDLILLDLMLPDISGEQICREIRKTSKVPIIMLTAKSQEVSILNGLDIGADDYITKPFSPRQMIARVKALLRRTFSDDQNSDMLSFNNEDLVINGADYTVKKAHAATYLTPSEFKILITLAKRPSKVFTREELISVAFEGDYLGYDRTIDSHIKNLRSKIEDDPKECKYIITVRGIGYKFGSD